VFWVWGVVVHTPGIAVCAAAFCWLCPPSSGGAAVHIMACAQFNYAVFVRGRYSHIWCVCVCVCVCVWLAHKHKNTNTHTHATPNSLVTHHTTHIAYEQSRMHSKGNIYMCVRTRAQYMHLYLQRSLSLSLMRERERESVVNLYYFPASSRATVPAEFKHINKRRKRNQQGFP
jgi:hypothetical protein